MRALKAFALQDISNDILETPFGVCLFSIKALNIWDSRMNATLKMEVLLRVIGFNLIHFPPLARMCFILKQILLVSCTFALHT